MDQKKLAKLRAARVNGIGRLLLLARKNFVTRTREISYGENSDKLPTSWSALLPYIDIDGTRSTELARRAGISKQAVGKIIRELEGLGMLTRTEDPMDRRAFLVTFTEHGLQRLQATHQAIAQAESEIEQRIGSEKMILLRETLHRLAYPDQDTQLSTPLQGLDAESSTDETERPG